MFTLEDRERVRARVLELAASDARVVAGAVVGSLALGDGDRWSDLDLTFAVADGVPVADVLENWTRTLERELGAAHLFDLVGGPTTYRVFLLPGLLQFDLSFSPASQFEARGPSFRLLFGPDARRVDVPPPPAHELFGYAVHHALRARFAIERERVWQAEYWISAVRDYAFGLACLRRGLPVRYGRSFDELPEEVRGPLEVALVRSLERAELLRALAVVVDALLREGDQVPELAAKVELQLRALAGPLA